MVQYTRTSHQILLFIDLGTAKEPLKVDLSVRLCVSDIGISSSDIYKGVKLLSALYHICKHSLNIALSFFSMVGHPKAMNISEEAVS